ncbi:MAG: glycosyltransferase family 4 protein [Candidatus Magasanikbacteria bacterium]|nr:glycosyltransferase family 4 protein [Candidatus Magasanikbacteria bacterium]
MKIAHIVCTYPPYFGGMGNVAFQMASELSKLGHEVVVFTPDYYEKEEIKESDEPEAEEHTQKVEAQIDFAKRLPTPVAYGNAGYMPQIGKELDEFDLVHLHYPFFGTANLVRRWKLKNPHKPFVVTYHMDTRGSGWKGLIFKLYAKYWMPKILGVADKIIVSSFDYASVSDAGHLFQTHKEKWIELPFGVDIERFVPASNPDEVIYPSGLDPYVPILLFVGGMDVAHYFKGIPVLLDALRILKENNTPVQGVFVGDGEMREGFEMRARSYGLSKLVTFAGHVSDEDLPMYYRMADLCVLPSINQGEAFGMVLLEAMASGTPVIASDLPGVRTVAIDGGMVFEPGNVNALAQTIAGYFDPETEIDAWREKVRKVAEEKYSWESIVRSLEQVYLDLIK